MTIFKKIAIFAGSGKLPSIVASLCRQKDIPYIFVAFHHQTPVETVQKQPHFWTHLGTIGFTLEQLKTHGVEDIIFAGAIKRPSWSSLKVDRIGTQWLSQLMLKPRGDDQLLRFLSHKLKEQGYRVIGLNDLGNDLLMPPGILSQIQPSPQAFQDIEFGKNILEKIGFLDIGQAIVIQQGLILGIEAIEGTDELIKRTGLLKRTGNSPILIKIMKPQQDVRFDQPTIGLHTITLLKENDFQGLALQAHHCLLLEREKVVNSCKEYGLFFVGI